MVSEWHKSGGRSQNYGISKKVGRKNQYPKGDIHKLEELLRAGMSYHRAIVESGTSTHSAMILRKRLEAEGVKITLLTPQGALR